MDFLDVDDLEDLTDEDLVHPISGNDVDYEELQSEKSTKFQVLNNVQDVINDSTYLGYTTSLKELLEHHPGKRCSVKDCHDPYSVVVQHIGSAAHVTWVSTIY